MNVLKAAAQGAKSENSDLKEVLGGLTTSMHDFGFGQDKAADVMSKMVAAVGMAKTNFQDFSGALHSVEPVAAAVGTSLADVYGSLAQITQSGTAPAQAAQNMARAFTTLSTPTQKMRDELGQLGLNAEDLSQHLGQRGLAGTLQIIASTIRDHMNPQQQVMIDTFYKSEQAGGAAKKMFDSMPPAVQAVVKSVQDGTLSYKEFRKTRGGLDVEQANELQQWLGLQNKLAGYSNALKSGTGDVQTFMQAMTLATGNQETAKIALQLTGDATEATNQKIKEIDGTTREHDGTVKGFNETQSTLNAKMADAKAAFGAAAIEIGTAFIPVMTDVANVAKDVGDAMAKHPRIVHDVINAVELLGGAWAGFKALNIAEAVLAPIVTKMVALTGAEDAAAGSAAGLGKAMGLIGSIGIAGGAAALAANSQSDAMKKAGMKTPEETGGFWGNWDELKQLFHQTFWSGGAISGSGPKGKDSVPAWLAPGEHVLTADEVDKMGGQQNVYAFRKALHFDQGGSPDFGASRGTPTVGPPDENALAPGFSRTSASPTLSVPARGRTPRTITTADGITPAARNRAMHSTSTAALSRWMRWRTG